MSDVHGWLDELGIVATAPMETIHERPWSTVLRVPTAEGDLYLKQEAPVQASEVALTVALGRAGTIAFQRSSRPTSSGPGCCCATVALVLRTRARWSRSRAP